MKAWSDLSETEKINWAKLMLSKDGRKRLRAAGPAYLDSEQEKQYNAIRLALFWERMARLRDVPPVPYLACDVSSDPSTFDISSYAILEQRNGMCSLLEIGHVRGGTSSVEFYALLRACRRADEHSVVISDHVSQLRNNAPVRDEVAAWAEDKRLKFYGRPSCDPRLPGSPEDPHVTLRQRLYSRAHAAARLVNLKVLVDPSLLFTNAFAPS